MKVVPLGESVVVRPLDDSTEPTSGGLVLPSGSKSGPAHGKVLSVGDGRLMPDGTRTPLQVQEGDRILYNSWAGTRIDVDGSELLVMNGSDILGTLG